jgi:hypothetical protein
MIAVPKISFKFHTSGSSFGYQMLRDRRSTGKIAPARRTREQEGGEWVMERKISGRRRGPTLTRSLEIESMQASFRSAKITMASGGKRNP